MSKKRYNPIEANLRWILQNRSDVVNTYNRRLAFDFDTPANDIVAQAAKELGITPEQWTQLQHIRIEEAQRS